MNPNVEERFMIRSQLHHLIAHTARAHPDAPALTHKDATITYAGLWQQVVQFGNWLADMGVEPGERVAIYLDKRPETVIAIFGTSAARAVFVPVNPLLRPRQVAYILADCDVTLLITTTKRFHSLADEIQQRTSVERVVLVGNGDSATDSSLERHFDVISWPPLDIGDVGHLPAAGIDADMAAILYTSGSTGKPKGVVLSHRNLVAGADSVNAYLDNTCDDVILSVLPLSFDAGFSQLTTGFSAGAHVVLMNYLLPQDVVRLCEEHGVTALTCVPPLWIQIAEQCWPEHVGRKLRYFANTGGRMPKATLQKLRCVFPEAKPFLMYGLTESFRSTYLDPAEVDRRPDSIGKAIPNNEVLVVRPDGSECEPGEEGELVHRGALVAMGYWNDPERTAARFRTAPGRTAGLSTPELAVWSGDVVVRDAAGFLYFMGRNDEMIKTLSYRVSPTEVEEVAYDSGLVGDAVALGVDDPRLGQRIVLVVSPNGGFDPRELLAKMKHAMPSYMVPQHIELRDEIPRSANGKFDRELLRQELGQ
jgi:acyl-CoA ligase (AMP-forming) (exosortase A-associated)